MSTDKLVCEANDSFVLKVCWGSYLADGSWAHNPYIPLSEVQQAEENRNNGFPVHANLP